MTTDNRTIQVELTPDLALVLFEWTHRQEDEQYAGIAFADPAERIAFDHLSASLEGVVDVVFNADYSELLSAARARLSAQN